jgi:hypothetical protein
MFAAGSKLLKLSRVYLEVAQYVLTDLTKKKKSFMRLTCVIFLFNISGVKMVLVEFQSITRCLK